MLRYSDLNPETRQRFGSLEDVENAAPKRNQKDDAERTFAFQCRAHKLPMFKREYKFAAESHGRGWMFDFAWLEWKCALEVEGLVVKRVNGELIATGRHVTPQGFRGDAEKYATAAVLGWAVLRFEQTQITSGLAIDMTVQLLKSKGWKP